MNFGTVKSEVWAHMDDVGQEYYRYEIITRYWSNPVHGGYEWKHTVIAIDREGNVTNVLDREANEPAHAAVQWWTPTLLNFNANAKASGPAQLSTERATIADEHRDLVRLAMG